MAAAVAGGGAGAGREALHMHAHGSEALRDAFGNCHQLPPQGSGMKGSLYNRDEAMRMAGMGGAGGEDEDEDEVRPRSCDTSVSPAVYTP
jgi:hypothetical protein